MKATVKARLGDIFTIEILLKLNIQYFFSYPIASSFENIDSSVCINH